MCRFSEVAKIETGHNLQIEVDIETILLSPGITYAAYLADWTDNGWMALELCQFVSHKKVAKFEVLLESIPSYNSILFEGIQFLPVEMVCKP